MVNNRFTISLSFNQIIKYIFIPSILAFAITYLTYKTLSGTLDLSSDIRGIFTNARELIFPAIIAVLAGYFSYKATYISSLNIINEDRQTKKIDFIDRLIIEIRALISIFEALQNDPQSSNYFSYKNIGPARNRLYKLTTYFDTITLIENEEVRYQIITNVESANKVIDSIDILEDDLINKYRKLSTQLDDVKKIQREIEMNALNNNIILRESLLSNEEKNKQASDPKYKAYTILREEINNDLIANSDLHTQSRKEIELKRGYIAIQLVDVKSKLSDLINILEKEKTSNLIK